MFLFLLIPYVENSFVNGKILPVHLTSARTIPKSVYSFAVQVTYTNR
jgi:hypothetical protein